MDLPDILRYGVSPSLSGSLSSNRNGHQICADSARREGERSAVGLVGLRASSVPSFLHKMHHAEEQAEATTLGLAGAATSGTPLYSRSCGLGGCSFHRRNRLSVSRDRWPAPFRTAGKTLPSTWLVSEYFCV